ncbi:SusD/RagB family nutrient-binding outer membrane lipoprotein [Massilibacteroides sp.]|uniref:SusD/RagB family nutrient-binding outer membrane lipoprotein n=1 Tax=Massilibacteroides sp. TaxID=2034766 RepID=UPI00261854CF|nr:SusD/RagB family nutrient-binding outer membrane lipoprotein [Massilibacteroides sp.]MDD4513963.1 SusD/RagB family nutrient-binding outer membrane lipoprotein [Massilibacteroides sp.]
MKKYILYSLFTAITLNSCTGDFEEMNVDPNNLTEVGKREMPFMFAKAQSSSALNRSFYQTVQNLGADLYSQYFALTSTSFATDRYVLTPDWQRRFWTVVYVDTAPQLKSILENADPNSGEQALANILWVYAFHRLTDHFGPIPYFDAAEPQDVIPYDSMDKIYDDFFKRLDTAVTDLKGLSSGTTVFKGYEIMYDGNVDNWIRFANTLRLRLALRISNIDPDRAKTEAEAAVASGVLTDNSQNAFLQKVQSGNDTNGLAQVAAWNEFAMSSTIASYLKGYEDPRLSVYFQPSIKTGEYNSIRNGLSPTSLGESRNTPSYNSNVGTYWAVKKEDNTFSPNLTASFHIMCCAEAYFLRAEGALNGWNMDGTAKELYEEGIRKSFEQWEIENSADEYINSSKLPVAPGDSDSSPAVSTTPVKWAQSINQQREQIGTQKWLAIFPNGMEAWTEYRRSGYPVMYPVVQSDNSLLPQGTFINRLPYPLTEQANNAEELEKGRKLLGGPDDVTTKLWWDID